jgi:hypothetical protein
MNEAKPTCGWNEAAVSPRSEFNKPEGERDWHQATIEYRTLQRLIYDALDILTPIKNDDAISHDWNQLRDWMIAARKATR